MKKYKVLINDKKFIVNAQDELYAIKKVKNSLFNKKSKTNQQDVNPLREDIKDSKLTSKHIVESDGRQYYIEIKDTIKDSDFNSYYENQMNEFINNIGKWKYRENGTTILCKTTPGQRRNIENKIENELKKVFPNKQYIVWSKLKSENSRSRIGQLSGDKFYETNFEYRVKD